MDGLSYHWQLMGTNESPPTHFPWSHRRSGLDLALHTHSQPGCCLALHQFVFPYVILTVSKCLMTFPKRSHPWELEEPEGAAEG